MMPLDVVDDQHGRDVPRSRMLERDLAVAIGTAADLTGVPAHPPIRIAARLAPRAELRYHARRQLPRRGHHIAEPTDRSHGDTFVEVCVVRGRIEIWDVQPDHRCHSFATSIACANGANVPRSSPLATCVMRYDAPSSVRISSV